MSFIDILKSLLRKGCNLRKGGTKDKKPERRKEAYIRSFAY